MRSTSWEAHVGLARVNRDAGRVREAAAHFEAADRLRPLEGEALVEYFWAVSSLSSPTAVVVGRRVLGVQPHRADVRDTVIGLAARAGDERTALAISRDGAATGDASALWHRRIGESLLRQRDLSKAADAFELAVAMPDRLPTDAAQAAMARGAAGDERGAYEMWRRVPQATRDGNHEWTRAWLRAVTIAGPADAAVAALQSDLQAHADDEVTAGLLFDLYMRTGQAAKALNLSEQRAHGSGAPAPWLRRQHRAAVASGDGRKARNALERLVANGHATIDDRWQLATAVADNGDGAGTLEILAQVKPGQCEERVLRVLDRLADVAALAQELQQRHLACVYRDRWLDRVVTRAVAQQYHHLALRMLEAGGTAPQALRGQLLLWTGRPVAAIPFLERAVEESPRRDVVEALVDARRAVGDAAGAWQLARQHLISAPNDEQAVQLAELAADASEPHAALALVDGAGRRARPRADAVRGKAYAALARLESERLDARLNEAAVAARDGELTVATALVQDVLSSASVSERHRHDAAAVLEQVAGSLWGLGQIEDARVTADRILALDPARVFPWVIVVSSLGSAGGVEVHARLDAFERQFGSNVDAILAVADQVASLSGPGKAAAINRAIGWTDRLLAAPGATAAILITRARLFTSLQRWDQALDAVDGALRSSGAADRNAIAALRLRAQILAWSGQWKAAIHAYDRYLGLVPDDLEAQREAARVEGWRQAFGAAQRRYARLTSDAGGSDEIEAEARSKRAYFRGQWNAAVTEYSRWVAMSPSDAEAAFERAQVLERAGDLGRADGAYRDLLARTAHRQADAARRRFDERRRVTMQVFAAASTARGYDQLRMLGVQEQGIEIGDDVGMGAATHVFVTGSRLSVGDDAVAHRGGRVSIGVERIMSTAWRGAARLGWTSLDETFRTTDGTASLWWRPADGWELQMNADRTPVAENTGTIRSRLSQRSVMSGVVWMPSFDVRVAGSLRRGTLSDGNARLSARVDGRYRVLRGRDEVAVVGSSDTLAHRSVRAGYFSPVRFSRWDGGAEWRHWVRSPQFASDRGSSIAAGYTVGVDSRAVRYDTFSADGLVRVSAGSAVVIRGTWIRSRVYSSYGLTLGLNVLGSDRQSPSAWLSGVTAPQ